MTAADECIDSCAAVCCPRVSVCVCVCAVMEHNENGYDEKADIWSFGQNPSFLLSLAYLARVRIESTMR